MGLREVELQKHVKAARSWIRKLRKLGPAQRSERVGNAHSNYSGPIFCHLLLEEGRRSVPGDPGEVLSLADAALSASRKGGSGYHPDPEIRAAALALRGNAKRVLGRLGNAEADLEEAERLLNATGVAEFAIAGEVHSFLGSLRRDQNRLEEATHHLHRAATVYRALGYGEKTARLLLKLSAVHYLEHNPERAVAATEAALRILEDGSEARLRAYARYNLAHHLHAAGETDRAAAQLQAHEDLLASAGDEVAQHVAWLRGRIAWSRGDLPAATRRFTEARKRALALGLRYEEGLIALELALVELASKRTDRAQALADEALKVFADQEEVDRETRAALELLEATARREALDRHLLQRAVAALEQERHSRRPAAAGFR